MPDIIIQQKEYAGLPLRKLLRSIVGNTRIMTLTIGEERYTLETIKNTEQLLAVIDQKSFQVDERLPYWSALWPSAIALSEFIADNKKLFQGKRVLETGCGLGLCGIVATKIGAEVMLSDHDPLALYFAGRNYRRNFNRNGEVVNLDWRGPYLKQKFDLIIAADVLYEKRSFFDLIVFINRHITDDGMVVLAEPQRTVARSFFDQLDRAGWTQQVTKKQVRTSDGYREVNVNLLTLC